VEQTPDEVVPMGQDSFERRGLNPNKDSIDMTDLTNGIQGFQNVFDQFRTMDKELQKGVHGIDSFLTSLFNSEDRPLSFETLPAFHQPTQPKVQPQAAPTSAFVPLQPESYDLSSIHDV
jgi:hypothetical protein